MSSQGRPGHLPLRLRRLSKVYSRSPQNEPVQRSARQAVRDRRRWVLRQRQPMFRRQPPPSWLQPQRRAQAKATTPTTGAAHLAALLSARLQPQRKPQVKATTSTTGAAHVAALLWARLQWSQSAGSLRLLPPGGLLLRRGFSTTTWLQKPARALLVHLRQRRAQAKATVWAGPTGAARAAALPRVRLQWGIFFDRPPLRLEVSVMIS